MPGLRMPKVFLVFFLISLVLGGMPRVLADPVVDEAMALSRLGATDLALGVLARQPVDYQAQPGRWMAREQARIEILGTSERWEQVVERTQGVPVELPVDFVIWTRTRQAHALIALERGREARDVLRPLIWFGASNATDSWFRAWRRMLAESYSLDGRPEDALIALRRYRLDYGSEAGDAALLEARILLSVGRHEEAVNTLTGVDGHEAGALRILARFRAGALAAEEAVSQAGRAARGQDRDSVAAARYLAVAAVAARSLQDPVQQIPVLESALVAQSRLGSGDDLYRLTAEPLWQSYLRLGERLANERQLLIGDDEAWFALVDSLQARQPLAARGLLAVVALRSPMPQGQAQAHRRLSEQLATIEGLGASLLQALYLGDGPFGAADRVPAPVRHLLAETALGQGDLDTASRLMAGLERAPEGVDPFLWGLRRARTLILGGQEEAGIDGLYQVLSGVRQLEGEAADRFMQVLFDLQSVRRHQDALNLFQVIAPRLTERRRLRELMFWQADSHRALGEHEQAARLYLRSALLGDSTDMWALSARFQAAEALGEAGLVRDARVIYEDLIRRTPEAERRVVLRQRLQQLQLQQ
ncbi:hypothetical protein ECTPHS_00195 [Ectothiorhodospira sp. PHS-1]|nr:hypothetical protein ECTPHS_00195 [Ectothiorhodospira sp. PHS-1]